MTTLATIPMTMSISGGDNAMLALPFNIGQFKEANFSMKSDK